MTDCLTATYGRLNSSAVYKDNDRTIKPRNGYVAVYLGNYFTNALCFVALLVVKMLVGRSSDTSKASLKDVLAQ